MLGRVVERVAHPDALENQFRRLPDHLGVPRLTAAEGACVDFSEPLAERIGEDLGRIEQEGLPSRAASDERSLAAFSDCFLSALLDPTGRSQSPTIFPPLLRAARPGNEVACVAESHLRFAMQATQQV